MATLKTIEIKGNAYVLVSERIRAFREAFPNYGLSSEILSIGEGVVTIKATITDEQNRVIATGHAQEKEQSSYINKTSYVENCETSAFGRALGALGIGIDTSFATAEEVANAIKQQGDMKAQAKTKKVEDEKKADEMNTGFQNTMENVPNATQKQTKRIEELLFEIGKPLEALLKKQNVKTLGELTEVSAASIIKSLENLVKKDGAA